jgi:hypothetical protein
VTLFGSANLDPPGQPPRPHWMVWRAARPGKCRTCAENGHIVLARHRRRFGDDDRFYCTPHADEQKQADKREFRDAPATGRSRGRPYLS